MNRVAIAASPSIKSQFWLETQLIDTLFECDDIYQVFLTDNTHQYIKDLLKKRKYKIFEFPTSWEEFGLGAIPHRNLSLLSDCNLFVALWDGKSRGILRMIEAALRKKIPMNIRYYQPEEQN